MGVKPRPKKTTVGFYNEKQERIGVRLYNNNASWVLENKGTMPLKLRGSYLQLNISCSNDQTSVK